jgi:hypothetical protein
VSNVVTIQYVHDQIDVSIKVKEREEEKKVSLFFLLLSILSYKYSLQGVCTSITENNLIKTIEKKR